jgi:hypothetical protein
MPHKSSKSPQSGRRARCLRRRRRSRRALAHPTGRNARHAAKGPLRTRPAIVLGPYALSARLAGDRISPLRGLGLRWSAPAIYKRHRNRKSSCFTLIFGGHPQRRSPNAHHAHFPEPARRLEPECPEGPRRWPGRLDHRGTRREHPRKGASVAPDRPASTGWTLRNSGRSEALPRLQARPPRSCPLPDQTGIKRRGRDKFVPDRKCASGGHAPDRQSQGASSASCEVRLTRRRSTSSCRRPTSIAPNR